MTLAVPGVAPAPASPQNDTATAASDAGDGGGADSFGKVLSSNLAKRPDASAGPAKADRIAPNGDGTDRGVNPGRPTPGRSTNGTADGTPAADPKHGGHDADDRDDAVGDDLAAQLALVSQWAGLATQGTTAAPGGLGIKEKLDTVRGVAGQTTLVPGVAIDRPAVPALDPQGTTGFGAADPGDKSLGTAASKSLDLRATLDATVASFDKFLAANAPGTHGPLESAAPGSLFAAPAAMAPGAVERATAAVQDPALTAALREPVGSPAWAHEVGQTALRMAANDTQSISLRLNPEHLGPLDVQLRVDDGVAHLQFVATHADTRQALESSRATLDQMFGQQGMKLGEWSVGQQSQGRGFGDPTAANGGGRSAHDGSSGDDRVVSVVLPTTRTLGLVDTFA
jgi:flagellar hook-length control protein FliK